jgi:hypothetical protein
MLVKFCLCLLVYLVDRSLPVNMSLGVLFFHTSIRLSNHRSTAWTRDSVRGEEALVSSNPKEDMASSVILWSSNQMARC